MAGGSGVRLWPRSTERKPKQFTHMLGDGTLIQNTLSRLLPAMPVERVFLVTTHDLTRLVDDQLPQLSSGQIILEPFARNTAPALALSAYTLRKQFNGDTVVIATPSDHLIYNVREFHNSLDKAVRAAREFGSIVTVGVMPTRPETGFGYVQVGEDVATTNPLLDGMVKIVKTFAEKPDMATAQRFLDAGDFLWNSGIFVATIETIIDNIEKYLPDHAPLFQMLDRHIGKESYKDVLDIVYRQMRSVSFDYGVMERADNVYVVESTFGWSDIGTWDELYRLSMKDGKNNVVEGNVMTVDSSNCFVTGTTGRMIGMVGVDDLIVVESEFTTFICHRGESERVKELVDLLRRRKITHHL